MLLIKTKVLNSKVAGYGLFADQFIPKNTIIWKFNELLDKKIHIHDIVFCSQIERMFLDKYAYREGEYLIICTDEAKYINHSSNPNTDDFIDKEHGSITIANKDINIGDEIVSNYESFDNDFSTYKEFLNSH